MYFSNFLIQKCINQELTSKIKLRRKIKNMTKLIKNECLRILKIILNYFKLF
jgi:hypothetical protein